MKRFFQVIGAGLFTLWLLGMLGVIDFRICINAPGHCGAGTIPAGRSA